MPVKNYNSENKFARKRTDLEIARDRALIAELYLTGDYSDQKITEFMNSRPGIGYEISRQTVTVDRKRLLEQLQEEGKENTGLWLQEEIFKLSIVEREAWEAWKKSTEETRVVKEIEELLTDKDGVPIDEHNELVLSKVETLISQNVGNPKWLQVILDCVEKRSRLRGLYKFQARIETDTEVRVKTYYSFSPVQWDQPGNPTLVIDQTTTPEEKRHNLNLPGESHE